MDRMPPPPRCLPLATAVIGALVAAFVALTLAVVAHSPAVAAADAAAAAALGGLAEPAHALLKALSALHVPRGIVALTALGAAALWVAHARSDTLVLLAAVLGGATINHLLKHTIQRPRPGQELVLPALTDFSFPSGHVANSTLLYGTLAALVVLRTASWPRRAAAVAAALALVAGIGVSRIALGAHHASDVVAGALVGATWITVCLAVRCLSRRRPGRPRPA